MTASLLLVAGAALVGHSIAAPLSARSHTNSSNLRHGSLMTMHAHGPFDVALAPQAHVENVGDANIGRMSIDKQFHGDLEAKSLGQMLAFSSPDVKGSAGYVAMERVDGTLMRKRGTFVLQHSSTMDRGVAVQSITVVADSGTGELVGLSGNMTITITDKKHFYDFAFQCR